MIDELNYFWFSQLIASTESIKDGHFYYTPKWHSVQNILLQVCFQDVNNKQEVAGRMFDLVRNLVPSRVFAVNGYMGLSLAADIADSFGKATCKGVIHAIRPGNGFEVPGHFDPLHADDTVLVVAEGIITGTAIKQAVDWIISSGARPIGVVAAYNRYPEGLQAIEAQLGIHISVIADLKTVYRIFPIGIKTCDACLERKSIDDQLQTATEQERMLLSRRKQPLDLTWGYAQMWGQIY